MITTKALAAETNEIYVPHQVAHAAIRSIMATTNAPAVKARLLEQYVKIADTKPDITAKLGSDADKDGFGAGFEYWTYLESGLQLMFNPYGKCVQIEAVNALTGEPTPIAGSSEQSWPEEQE